MRKLTHNLYQIYISIILKLSIAFPTSVLDLHINTLLCLSFFGCLLPTYSTFTNRTGNPLRLFRYIRKKYNLKLLNNEINAKWGSWIWLVYGGRWSPWGEAIWGLPQQLEAVHLYLEDSHIVVAVDLILFFQYSWC